MDDRFFDIIAYFKDRATNAFAESLNAKLKDFRTKVKGVSDAKYFLYRVSIFF